MLEAVPIPWKSQNLHILACTLVIVCLALSFGLINSALHHIYSCICLTIRLPLDCKLIEGKKYIIFGFTSLLFERQNDEVHRSETQRPPTLLSVVQTRLKCSWEIFNKRRIKHRSCQCDISCLPFLFKFETTGLVNRGPALE